MINIKYNYRNLNYLGALLSFLFLMSAYFIEFVLHQNPCSLCLLQRYALWMICILFFLAAFHNPKHLGMKLFYNISTFILSAGAFAIAARQIWIQHLPKESAPNCVADLQRILKFQPLSEALQTIFMGGGECREANFTLLGLSLAEISALLFFLLACFSILIMLFEKKGGKIMQSAL